MVSIILVNYNGSVDTLECIESLSRVPRKDVEIIVVDNGSIDDSARILEDNNNGRYILIKESQNNGFSAGNNIGIKYAINNGADYIILLNNDTLVTPDFVDHLLMPFSLTNCYASTCKIMFASKPKNIWYAGGKIDLLTSRSEHFKIYQPDDNNDVCMQVNFASGCCLCLSKGAIEQVGLLSEEYFLYEEDADYCFRIISKGGKIIYNPKGVIFHKVSASTKKNSSLTTYYQVRNKYLFIQKYYIGYRRVIAFLYCTLQFWFRCCKKELLFKDYISGVKGFLKKETGKR